MRILLAFLLLFLSSSAWGQSNVIVNYQGATGVPVQASAANPLPVNASVSASISGFAPGGNFAHFTSTASSADSALPTGAVVVAFNTGTTAVSCNLTIGAGSAAANETVIEPSAWFAFTVGSNTHISCINQAGDSTSNVVVLSGGTGLPTGASNDAASLAIANGYLSSIVTNTGAVIPNCALAPGACNFVGNVGTQVYGATYNTIAASQTAQALTGGSGGATGDYLSHCVVIPTSTSPGVITILDNSTAIYSFPGGASSLSNLVPFTIPVGAKSVSGAWKITTGASLSVVCVGKFT